MKENKCRLDALVMNRYPALSKTYIQSLIMQGKILVEGVVVNKPGTACKTSSIICINILEQRYVSRAGFKLEKGLDYFHINVEGLIALDAGLSTGGFTDCLLQRGIKKVYGVDVGYGQVHEKIRGNPRVVLKEKTNLRHLATLPQKVDLITLDLSFISVLKVMEVVAHNLNDEGKLIVLIKPQFEADKASVGRGGIIKDTAVHERVKQKVIEGITTHGFSLVGVIESPITGTDGNKEFLAYFKKQTPPAS